jgi:hypothetical protein
MSFRNLNGQRFGRGLGVEIIRELKQVRAFNDAKLQFAFRVEF